MATQDNASAIEFTAQWTDDPTHVHLYDALTGGTRLGAVAVPSAISPASGATVRIPAGDLNLTVTAGTGALAAFEADILAVLGNSDVPLYVGLGTSATVEIAVTDYARQQLTAANIT